MTRHYWNETTINHASSMYISQIWSADVKLRTVVTPIAFQDFKNSI